MWQGQITILAHVIHFLSFLGAVFSADWVKAHLIIKYLTFLTQPWLQSLTTWVAVYVAAMYLLPKIGFWIAQAFLMDK